MVSGRLGDGVAEIDRSEKITINVGPVDLGQIDLLVNEGFYANRTDFIRTAIRRQLDTRADAVNETVTRRALKLGTQHLSRHDLEKLQDAGQTIDLHVLGLATIAQDVSPDLALATISSVDVLGAFRAPRDVKTALATRTT
jgi:Arc/MetJ-type ribon-helix-helix transcriptional regulator